MCVSSAYPVDGQPATKGPPRAASAVGVATLGNFVPLNDASHQLDHPEQELNPVQPSTVCLPADVLSYIFEHACSQVNTRTKRPPLLDLTEELLATSSAHFAITLCSVSSGWRQLALSTPRLWTTPSLYFRYGHPDAVAGKMTLLRMYLDKSCSLPLSLEICRHPDVALEGESDVIGEMILQNASRIRMLQFSMPHPTWTRIFFENKSKFVLLRDLGLGGLDESHEDSVQEPFRFEWFRSLRGLRLSYPLKVQVPGFKLTLTNLELTRIPIAICVQLLLTCPNLIEFRSFSPLGEDLLSDPPNPLPMLDTGVITLSHLRVLGWSLFPSSWCDALLARLRLPKLHTLILSDPLALPSRSFWHFVNYLPPSLRTLELTCLFWESQTLRLLFGYMTRLRELVVWYCGSYPFEETLKALTPSYGMGVNWLPLLRKLTLDGCRMGPDAPVNTLGPLERLMEKREGRGSRFKVEWVQSLS